MASKKLKRVLIWISILGFTEIFVFNIKWIEYRILGETTVPFSFPPAMAVIYAIILFSAAFKEELEKLIFKLDGYLLGDMSLKPFVNFTTGYEKTFVLLAAIFGLLFVFVIPPMFAPDETNHFTRACLLAHGQFLPVLNQSKNAVGNVSPDLQSFIQTWNGGTCSMGKKVTLAEYHNLITSTLSQNSETVQVNYPYPYLSFFMYIPQSIGIAIGRLVFSLFHASRDYNIYIQLIFSRISNLTTYIVFIFLSIRITPIFKRTLTILALMPMSIFIAASCSYDVFMYSFCILYLAYILKLTYDPDIRLIEWNQKLVLILLQFLILVGKYVYFPLLFLIFLIPSEKFHCQSKKKIFLAVALPSLILLSIWLIIYKLSVAGMAGDAFSSAYKGQAFFVLFHPIKYFAILMSNLNICRESWMTGFVGLFGWLNVPMPMAFVLFYIVLLLFSAVIETVINQSCLSRPLLGLVAAACYVLVATAEYVIWTPGLGNGKVGQDTIIGVQGRYFIPFAFPILLLFVNKLPYRTYLFGVMDVFMHKCYAYVLTGTLIYAAVFLLQTYWIA